MNRYNSTIKIKPCKCGCGKMPKLGYNGYAGVKCMPEELQKKTIFKRSEVIKRQRQYKANLAAKIHKAANDTKKDKSGQELAVINSQRQLAVWFIERMEKLPPKCENCGAEKDALKLPRNGIKWKSCQAHLLPKRHFDSLKTHPLNGMVLGSGFSGLCHCHDFYDSSWEKAAKMPIWEEVVMRFLIMYPLIPQEEYQFIPPQLLQELPENQI